MLVPAVLLHSMAVRVSVVTQRSLAHLMRDEYHDRPAIRYALFGSAYVSLMAHLVPQVVRHPLQPHTRLTGAPVRRNR
jgi:hypothetical protein